MTHPYAEIPELQYPAGGAGVVRIPMEQDVPVTARVRALIDCPDFQRLRKVTQLALTSQVYPGATHTRFEHALGVYHNALQYLSRLGEDPRFAEIVSSHDAEVLIAAALLHDVGHWPFCHPVEDLELASLPPHEEFAGEFLAEGSEIALVLRSAWGIEPSEVLDLLVARDDSSSARLRRSILSGPIDIDKMDYLARDSRHCGVPYGCNFDRNRLIRSLILNDAGDGLAITSKGRTAAEMMVFARYVMFSEVYWHHAVRAATNMFARAFFELHGRLPLRSMFRMEEPEMIRVLCEAAEGTEVSHLTDSLFRSSRRLHKRVAEFSIFHQPELYSRLRAFSYADLTRLSDALASELAVQSGLPLRKLDVLIDAPPRHREVEFRVQVRMSGPSTWLPLRDVSPIVNAMSQTSFDDCVKRVRIFVSAEHADFFRRNDDLTETVRTLLARFSVTE